jgi:NhaA family Na+:H+ antiporter
MAILLASLTAGVLGFGWLKAMGSPVASDTDPDTMDLETERAR